MNSTQELICGMLSWMEQVDAIEKNTWRYGIYFLRNMEMRTYTK